MEAQIKKKINHDSMWIAAKFPSGAHYKFKVDRRGERLEVAFSNDTAELCKQTNVFRKWITLRKGENNEQRFNRLEALTKECKSGKELIHLMT